MPRKGSGFHLHTDDLRKTGSDLGDFSDRLSQHGSRLQNISNSVSNNARRDRSGVGSKIVELTDKASGVFDKFVTEASRVTGQSGKNLHTGADAVDQTERANHDAIKKLHPHLKYELKAGTDQGPGHRPPKFTPTLPTIPEEKRVRFDNSAKADDGPFTYRPRPSRTDNPARTGSGVDHFLASDEPTSGTHPLKWKNDTTQRTTPERPHVVNAAIDQATELRNQFVNRTRPGMAGSMQAGDTNVTHSSMKGGTPNRHPIVNQLLKEIEDNGYPKSRGHGHCAEIGAISDYLHRVDPHGNWSIEDARKHFEHIGTATSAYRPGRNDNPPEEAPPCDTCSYVTHRLGIYALYPQFDRETRELKDFKWDKRI